jgi:hypothetical protein
MPTISITKTVSLEQTVEKILPEIPESPYLSERTAGPLLHLSERPPVPVLKAIFLSDNNMPDGTLIYILHSPLTIVPKVNSLHLGLSLSRAGA